MIQSINFKHRRTRRKRKFHQPFMFIFLEFSICKEEEIWFNQEKPVWKKFDKFFFCFDFFFWNFEIPKRKNKKHSIFAYIKDVTDVITQNEKKNSKESIMEWPSINFCFVCFLEKLKNIFCFFCIMYTCLVYIKCIPLHKKKIESYFISFNQQKLTKFDATTNPIIIKYPYFSYLFFWIYSERKKETIFCCYLFI